jgi:hypothetical protein
MGITWIFVVSRRSSAKTIKGINNNQKRAAKFIGIRLSTPIFLLLPKLKKTPVSLLPIGLLFSSELLRE